MIAIQKRWILVLSVLIAAFAAPGVHAQTITPLIYDHPVTGQITRDVFRQVYTVAGHAGEVIMLTLTATSGALDPALLVTDEQNNLIARGDDSGKHANAAIQALNLPRDATYFVIATRFGQDRGSTTGSYTLLLTRVGAGGSAVSSTPDANSAPVVLHYGDSVVGQIGDVFERAYAFTAQRGDLITITMQRISGDLDPFVVLADSQGTVLALNDDDSASLGTLDAAIREWRVRISGSYLIIATRFGRGAGPSRGDFALTLDRVPLADMGSTAARAILMDYGTSLSGTIDSDALRYYYEFEAKKGDVITLDAERTRGNLDPTLTLYSADMKKIADHDQGQRGQSARISAFTVPQDGVYLVVVGRYNAEKGFSAGDFTLSLIGRQGVTVGPRGILLMAYGGAVTSAVDSSNPNQEYVFEGKAGDIISIDMEATSGDLEPSVLLFDSTRHLLTQDDSQASGAQIGRYKLPATGAYVIVASRHGRVSGKTSGSYLLTLTKESG